MECRDAQFYLRLRRHAADELGADVTAPLDGHLATCAACAAEARGAASFDRALSSAMRAVPVPSGLRERLITQAARARGVALRHKAYRAGGLVAAALLVIGIGFSVFTNTRPKLDPDALARQVDDQINNPEESTRRWLNDQKLPDRLPVAFDYDLLVTRGFERIEGRYVPVVVFRSPLDSGFAKVYVFRSAGEFDLKDIRDAQASHARGQVVIGQEQFRGFTYVFVHTGRDLQPFLRTRNGGAVIQL